MIKEIVIDLEQLSERCEEIDVRKEGKLVQQITLDLKQTLREHSTGVGLAANQIGYDKRIFVINFNGDLRTFINPIITNAKGLTLNREQCLSLPDKTFIRPRNNEIQVTYQTPLGKIESRKMVGLAACVFQHELDHLDGLTLADVGLEIDEKFDKATEQEREELINAYLESLDLKRKQVNEEIENDDLLKQTSSAITFMEKVQKGEIEFDGQVSVKKGE